ncbi:DUF2851 family protein [Filimonas effusa]|uniref:DUF2851 family protein n=1 Tax=Filimonas effusa TaxID=2508721 RepID=A0A4Q1DBZ8_9BACT|nr:DUF2851 family protein [Filimonas effusa]RXK86468.1 DUF2851 family protein [Filimonas effusa]
MLTYPLPIAFLREELLQFIWAHRYYNQVTLYSVQGDPLQVIAPGKWNKDQGPDFLNAQILIGGILWVGNVEIHIYTSDWYRHRHHCDRRYDNVILHVVWSHDKQPPGNAAHLAILELQPLVANMLLQHYAMLMHNAGELACSWQLPCLSPLAWLAFTERLAVERLCRKADEVLLSLQAAGNHWEEVCWWQLARSYGMKVNAGCFEQIARSLPVKLLIRHKHCIQQLEALLLGQANLLNDEFTDSYPQMLQREYRFLQHKYRLPVLKQRPAFLRLRPAAFPSLRLAQMAMLLHQKQHLFAFITETEDLASVITFFEATANDYWHYHYSFNDNTSFQPKKLGKAATAGIIINAVIPLLFAYGRYKQIPEIQQRAIDWLSQIPPEQNTITRKWVKAGISVHNATDTQALIELTGNYCNCRRCLNCAIGNKILRTSGAT